MAQPSAVIDLSHTPDRPSWDCRSCGKPWPCDPSRETLLTEMGRVELAIYMWNQLEAAALELPRTPPTEFFERFIKWTY